MRLIQSSPNLHSHDIMISFYFTLSNAYKTAVDTYRRCDNMEVWLMYGLVQLTLWRITVINQPLIYSMVSLINA